MTDPTARHHPPQGHARRAWSNRVYEEQCFFFNSIVRPARHAHGVSGAALDATWDCASEVEIWRQYKLRADPGGFGGLEKGEQDRAIAELSVALTRHLEGAQGREWLRRVDWSVVNGEHGGNRGGGGGGGGGKWRGDGRYDDREEGRRRSGGGWQGHDDRHRHRDKERERGRDRERSREEDEGEEGERKRRRRRRRDGEEEEEGRKGTREKE